VEDITFVETVVVPGTGLAEPVLFRLGTGISPSYNAAAADVYPSLGKVFPDEGALPFSCHYLSPPNIMSFILHASLR